ncbi:MAG: hypothetical protein DRP01_02240 [Archaeoglobales archaeon]|nr:MAG: hypothetical protein DRP01_02240 [Archaeoglobales archaeon]
MYTSEIDPEELQRMSKLLADTLLEQFQQEDSKAQFTLITCVSGYEVIREDQITEVVNLDLVASATAGVLDPFGQLKEWFTSIINSISSWIVSSVTAFIDTYVTPTLDTILYNVSTVISDLADIPTLVVSAITQEFPDLISSITDSVVTSINVVVLDPIEAFVTWVSDQFTALMPIADTIMLELTTAQEVVYSLTDLLTNLQVTAPEIVTSVSTAIWQQLIVPLFEEINTSIIEPLTENVNNVIVEVETRLQQASEVITNLSTGILQFPEWFPTWFEEYISKPIVEAITFPMITNPASWITTSLNPMIGDLTDSLLTGSQIVWNVMLEVLGNVVETLWKGIEGLMEVVGEVLRNAFTGAWSISETLGRPFEKFVKDLYQPVPENMAKQLEETTIPVFKEIFKEFGIETPEYLKLDQVSLQLISGGAYTVSTMFMPFWGQLPIRLASWILRAIASWVSNQDWKMRISLKPLGIGVETEFSWSKALGASITRFSKSLMKWLDEIGRGMVYGYSIWLTQPIAKTLNFWFRNFIPIQLPSLDIMREYARRTLPHETSPEIIKLFRYYMGLYGYSDIVLDQFFKPAQEFYIQVTDRFGSTRKVPLSLIYELPSAKDVATMMVRDIFPSMEEFQKLYLARGMTPDIGALYYFLRFRYPPPEKLWQFVTRGISGLLWTTLTSDELDEIKKEIEAIGAHIPVSPAELNFQANKLLSAFRTYMKWHDYFRGAWIKDFPSDNLIYIDTLADIPTKIDQRWMTRWGLYQLLAEKGVQLSSPISEFREKILENSPASEIIMDLTLFSRTLQATGLHPDWTPLTAVAETINALTDERTLLRTGFINLFKEGFWDITALETLLAGIVKTSFQVSYFDTNDLQWKTGWINYPVMFLPAERKLLELRALMDRALDILRETVRDISRGYSEWIIEDYNEFKEKLTNIIDNINEFFAEDYKGITGVDLPENLKLKFVEAYYKPYIASLDIYKDIYTVRRVRYWTQRWLGWVMYRLATGVVSREDVQSLITYVGEKAKLTPYETEFIEGVLERLIGIAQREYVPTPSMLATISEYVPRARQLFDKVVEARNIPQEWKGIWADYVDLRPIVDEVKKMVSRVEDLYVYFMIKEEDFVKVLEEVKNFGYTDKEIELMLTNARYERHYRAWRELIGDVDHMTMLAEYSPEARSFALGQLYKMIDALPIAEETKAVLKKMWEQFIRLKPIMDEVRRYITELLSDFAEGIITEEEFVAELEALKQWGLDDYEIMFYKAIGGMRRARYLARKGYRAT